MRFYVLLPFLIFTSPLAGQLKETLESEWSKVRSNKFATKSLDTFASLLKQHLKTEMPKTVRERFMGIQFDEATGKPDVDSPIRTNFPNLKTSLWYSRTYSIEQEKNGLVLRSKKIKIPLKNVNPTRREFEISGKQITPSRIACNVFDDGAILVLYGFPSEPIAVIRYSREGKQLWTSTLWDPPQREGSSFLTSDCQICLSKLGVMVFYSRMFSEEIYCLNPITGKQKFHIEFKFLE